MAHPAIELERARGHLRLRFKLQGSGTKLGDLYQQGCLKARFPKHALTLPVEAVLINTAGGLTDGDELTTAIEWDTSTQAVVTTQAAERIYDCRKNSAQIKTTLSVADKATACWLPQETILFDNSRLQRETRAELGEQSRLFAVESLIFGRTAMREELRSGQLFDRFRIYQNGKLVFTDALQLNSENDETICERLRRRSVLGDARCSATLLYAGNVDETLLAQLRMLIEASPVIGGASDLGAVIVMRIVASDSKSMRELILSLYTACLGGYGYSEPRVWHC